MALGYWGVTPGEIGADGTAVAELQALAPGVGGRSHLRGQSGNQ